MSVPLVYVAGPYTGKTHDADAYHAIDYNIGVAREAAAWLVKNGLYFFCPHLNSAHFEVITPDVPPDVWYALDIRILRHCDAMLVVGNWRASSGTMNEIAFCAEVNIPVFDYNDDMQRAALLTPRFEVSS